MGGLPDFFDDWEKTYLSNTYEMIFGDQTQSKSWTDRCRHCDGEGRLLKHKCQGKRMALELGPEGMFHFVPCEASRYEWYDSDMGSPGRTTEISDGFVTVWERPRARKCPGPGCVAKSPMTLQVRSRRNVC